MANSYGNIQWVIQQNLTSPGDLQKLKTAFSNIDIGYTEIEIIPFNNQLPPFNRDKSSIFYGSTTMGELIMADSSLHEGFFFNPTSFSMANYFEKWGSHMLNFGALVTTFSDLMGKSYDTDKLLFIRPDDDSKSFSGEVKQYGEIRQWYDQLKMIENTSLSLDSTIIVSEPYHLRFEWRLWIVNKQVIAASKYREDFRLKKEKGCPPLVKQFAEQRCAEYTPHDVFVMDICESGDGYFIVECGCLNSAGFYEADIEAIVGRVTEYFSTMV
jgi:hypothetical protein